MTLKCPQCSTEMIKARATNFGEEYDYCKVCKKELKEMAPFKANPTFDFGSSEAFQGVAQSYKDAWAPRFAGAWWKGLKIVPPEPIAVTVEIASYYLDANGQWQKHDDNNPPPSTL